MNHQPTKRGRPPTSRGAYVRHRILQIGRVDENDRALLKAGADAAGETFQAWSLGVLKAAARRELLKEAAREA